MGQIGSTRMLAAGKTHVKNLYASTIPVSTDL